MVKAEYILIARPPHARQKELAYVQCHVQGHLMIHQFDDGDVDDIMTTLSTLMMLMMMMTMMMMMLMMIVTC